MSATVQPGRTFASLPENPEAAQVEQATLETVERVGPAAARDELVQTLSERPSLLRHAETSARWLGPRETAASLKHAVRERMMQLQASSTKLPNPEAAAHLMNALAPFNLPATTVSLGNSSLRHAKPVALVTGATRPNNIGFASARELGRRGYTVILTGRDGDAAENAAEALRAEGHDVRGIRLDVTEYDQGIAAAQWIATGFGRIDAVVNAAGATRETMNSQAQQVDGFDFAGALAVNALGPFFLGNLFGNLMKERGTGTIINFGTGVSDMAGFPAYGAAKAALRSLSIQQDAELSPHGVRVRCFDPGWVRTDMGGPDGPMHPDQVAKEIADLVTDQWNPEGAVLTSPGWETHLRSDPPHTSS